MNQGIDVEANPGLTDLHRAAMCGKIETVELLSGVGVNAKDHLGMLCIMRLLEITKK